MISLHKSVLKKLMLNQLFRWMGGCDYYIYRRASLSILCAVFFSESVGFPVVANRSEFIGWTLKILPTKLSSACDWGSKLKGIYWQVTYKTWMYNRQNFTRMLSAFKSDAKVFQGTLKSLGYPLIEFLKKKRNWWYCAIWYSGSMTLKS